ncbi:MAG: hypothetical protein V2A73_18990, partial [Pseudomonadota bacterium]
PRGGKGCGVCGDLTRAFALCEETASRGSKDTVRMRQAGASPVFWLRVRQEHLARGIRELLRRLPRGVPVVCESNAARREIEPGVFLVLRKAGSLVAKPSCAEVLARADCVVDFHGRTWSLPPAALELAARRWRIRETSAVNPAGG